MKAAGAAHVDLPAVEGGALIAQPFSGFSVYRANKAHGESLWSGSVESDHQHHLVGDALTTSPRL